jgi:hypothetical protein
LPFVPPTVMSDERALEPEFHAFQHLADSIQTQRDRLRMLALDVGEPIGEGLHDRRFW